MRQAYKDPVNPVDGSWRMIYVGPNGQLIGSLKSRPVLPDGQGSSASGSGGFGSMFGSSQAQSGSNSSFGSSQAQSGSNSSFGSSSFGSSSFNNGGNSNPANPQERPRGRERRETRLLIRCPRRKRLPIRMAPRMWSAGILSEWGARSTRLRLSGTTRRRITGSLSSSGIRRRSRLTAGPRQASSACPRRARRVGRTEFWGTRVGTADLGSSLLVGLRVIRIRKPGTIHLRVKCRGRIHRNRRVYPARLKQSFVNYWGETGRLSGRRRRLSVWRKFLRYAGRISWFRDMAEHGGRIYRRCPGRRCRRLRRA